MLKSLNIEMTHSETVMEHMSSYGNEGEINFVIYVLHLNVMHLLE